MSARDPLADSRCDALIPLRAGDPTANCNALSPPGAPKGYRKALAELYRAHYRHMLRILRARMGSRQAAEEVLHEAYARMLELDRPEVAGFLANYVWKLIWDQVGLEKRKEVRRARLDPVALFEADSVAPSPETVLCDQQRLELLEKAIDRLPSKDMEAYLLRAQEGLSFKEIGARMGISERWAQMHVASAIKYCSKQIASAQATRRGPK